MTHDPFLDPRRRGCLHLAALAACAALLIAARRREADR